MCLRVSAFFNIHYHANPISRNIKDMLLIQLPYTATRMTIDAIEIPIHIYTYILLTLPLNLIKYLGELLL